MYPFKISMRALPLCLVLCMSHAMKRSYYENDHDTFIYEKFTKYRFGTTSQSKN